MTSSDEEFHQWLLATFREEADEILTGISNGLIELEKAGFESGSDLVEQIYRKTHSLKGAARAVNLRDIESICQNAENVFSLIKKGELTPDPELFDLLHKSITAIYSILSGERGTGIGSAEVVHALRSFTGRSGSPKPPSAGDISDPDIPPSPWEQKKPQYSESITLTGGSGGGSDVSPAQPEVRDSSGKSFSSPTQEKEKADYQESLRQKIDSLGHSGGDLIPGPVHPGGMVRIASHKLDRLIAGSDDLLTTRLFITHRMRELEDMMSSFSIWRWNHAQIEGDLQQIREYTQGIRKADLSPDLLHSLDRIDDFLRFDREYVTGLQHDLDSHIRATEVDRSALESSTREISDLIHDAVLVPVATILSTFSKFVREYSRSVGKKVELQISGKDIEMDRRILEAIKPPLMHLIHNSIDHGIEFPDIRERSGKPETGVIQVRVSTQSGSKVAIEVIDDGMGINRDLVRSSAVEKGVITSRQESVITDEEAIWLIFRSGLSTKPEVTDLSGRGLGLAIVDDSVTRLGGELMVESALLKGTTISIILPVRLATLRGVVVRSGSQTFVFPIQQVGKVIRVDPDSIYLQGNRLVVRLEDEVLRVIKLTDILDVPDTGYRKEGSASVPIVTLEYAGRQIACIVDDVIREQEIVVRPLGNLLRRVKRITGAVILGDGSVAMVLDPLEIIQEVFMTGRVFPSVFSSSRSDKKILIVDDSATSRAFIRRTLEMAGYQVQTAFDGLDAFGKLKTLDFDMVISDVDMPRMSGYTLTEKIRADDRYHDMPVLLVTSLYSTQDQDYGRIVGANAYVVKSRFDKYTFLAMVKELLYN